MTPLRLCSPQLGIRPDAVLGGEVYDREILGGLARLGVSVDIPLLGQLDHDRALPWQVRTGRLPTANTLRGSIPNALFFAQMAGHRYDVIRVFELRYVGWAATTMQRIRGTPVVFHLNHLEPGQNMHPIDGWLARRCQGFTTLSEHTRRAVIGHYRLGSLPGWVIPPGVDDRYQPQQGRRPKNHPVLLYLGAIIERKNLAVLIDAVALLQTAGWTVDLLLAGSGDAAYQQRLVARAAALGVGDRVRFLGRVTEAEKIALYNACDIFVFPSRREGFGMAPAEAMACGTPVIVADAGALPEVVGEAGILADPMRAESFSLAIQSLLDDPVRRRQLGAAGRDHVRTHFRWDHAARQTLAVYETVRSRRGR